MNKLSVTVFALTFAPGLLWLLAYIGFKPGFLAVGMTLVMGAWACFVVAIINTVVASAFVLMARYQRLFSSRVTESDAKKVTIFCGIWWLAFAICCVLGFAIQDAVKS